MFNKSWKFFCRIWSRTSSGQPRHRKLENARKQGGEGFGVLRDSQLTGWFNKDNGELFSGFAVHKEDTVLDVGCGDAPFARFCAMQGAHVIFVDIDPVKVRVTRDALRHIPARKVTPIVTDCDPLPLSSETVDKVISLEVLEHVANPKAFMDELVRVGKPGALYLITVPDPVIEKLQKKGLAPDEYFEKPNHIRIFERDDFTQLLSVAGLDIVQMDRFGFYWSMWWIFFWACRQQLSPPWHPVLQAWTSTWSLLLNTDDGPRIKRALDDFMPKTQLIIARKPH